MAAKGMGWVKQWVIESLEEATDEEWEHMMGREGEAAPKAVLDKFASKEAPADTTIFFYMAEEDLSKEVTKEVPLEPEETEAEATEEAAAAEGEAAPEAAEALEPKQMVKL